MVVCGEGGDVFMVPIQRGQRKPKWLTHKDTGEKRKKRPLKAFSLFFGVSTVWGINTLGSYSLSN